MPAAPLNFRQLDRRLLEEALCEALGALKAVDDALRVGEEDSAIAIQDAFQLIDHSRSHIYDLIEGKTESSVH